MEAPSYKMAVPCRCGGQAKVFGPSEFAPASHWGVYCSDNSCDKMVEALELDEAIEMWNENQIIELHL